MCLVNGFLFRMQNHEVVCIPDHLWFVIGSVDLRDSCFQPMQSDVGEKGADYATLRGSCLHWGEMLLFEDSCFQPSSNELSHSGESIQLGKKCLLVDVVEAASYVGIEHIFRLVLDAAKDRFNRIVAGTSWPESIAVNLSSGVTSPTRLQNRAC